MTKICILYQTKTPQNHTRWGTYLYGLDRVATPPPPFLRRTGQQSLLRLIRCSADRTLTFDRVSSYDHVCFGLWLVLTRIASISMKLEARQTIFKWTALCKFTTNRIVWDFHRAENQLIKFLWLITGGLVSFISYFKKDFFYYFTEAK